MHFCNFADHVPVNYFQHPCSQTNIGVYFLNVFPRVVNATYIEIGTRIPHNFQTFNIYA